MTSELTNNLINEKSPYLLQHAHNPVNWFPWGDAAFEKARREDKPIFLSIGYSTCHWCHVMAHESFEDYDVAEMLNRDYIAIKVDREERPDIDNVYMRACQAMTGSGGWPTSIFMNADGMPFFAGTYFQRDMFMEMLDTIAMLWKQDRDSLFTESARLELALGASARGGAMPESQLTDEAVAAFRRRFDHLYGGFGSEPKFPAAHNLMFLVYTAPEIAEKTLMSMYRGGIFDHIGGGFSRYSTDRYWLVPHFEKMLYDNALLAMAYLLAYEKVGKDIYRSVAGRTFQYLSREMRAPDGGFYSAQDADSEGVEGKFYLFTPDELKSILGQEDGERFCRRYGITPEGNFEGGSIPNLLRAQDDYSPADALLSKVYDYRKTRVPPHTDTKQLTAWNALAAAAYAMGARILRSGGYLETAKETLDFIAKELIDSDDIYVSITDGKRSVRGFIDDYAFYIFALLQMYQATLDESYLKRAVRFAEKAWTLFWDEKDGGFFFSGKNNETLIARPKESWDLAMPSGNSMMAYNLSRIALLEEDETWETRAEAQRRFMNREATGSPTGYGFYLYALLPVKKIVCALKTPADIEALHLRSDWAFKVTHSGDYPIINDKTTYYVCENGACRPPVNEL